MPEHVNNIPRWRLSLRVKLLIAVNVVLLIGLAVLMVLDYQRGLAERMDNKWVSMSEEASLVITAVEALEHHGIQTVQDYIDRACAQIQDAASPGHHIAVRFDDHTLLQAQSHDRASPAFANAIQQAATASDHRAVVNGETIMVGSHRRDGLVVFVSEYTRNVKKAAETQLMSRAGGIALVGIVLTGIINLVLLRMVTRPIGRLVEAVHRIGKGELGLSPARSTTTELDDLAMEIGTMSRTLAESEQQRHRQMAKARLIQQNLLPKPDYLQAVGIHHIHMPADVVGGDFFDVKILDENRVAIYMGDVTGHGVPAAMGAGMLKILFEDGGLQASDPAAVLCHINKRFHAVTLDGDFATMFMGVIDRHEGSLTYANAGHETGYLLRGDGRIDELKATGMLLGVDPDAGCELVKVSIAPGDVVVLLTDGLIETMSPSGKLLGRKAIINALAGDHFDSPYESASRLLQLAVNHRGAGSQSDDITLAVLRV